MKEATKRRIEALGLQLEDFEPKKESTDDRIKELENQNQMLTECILELADIIYA